MVWEKRFRGKEMLENDSWKRHCCRYCVRKANGTFEEGYMSGKELGEY